MCQDKHKPKIDLLEWLKYTEAKELGWPVAIKRYHWRKEFQEKRNENKRKSD